MGIWEEIARKCNSEAECEVKESKITLTIRSDKTLSLKTKSDTAEFYYNGDLFYRVYSRDNKICFSFEVISLSNKSMVMRIYDENLKVKDIYKFKKIEGFKKI